MRRYELLSHTADLRILAEGTSCKDVFCAALQGLCSVLVPGFDVNRETTLEFGKLEISSEDRTALLIDFLAEALYLMHKEKAALYRCDLDIHNDNSLTVTFFGVNTTGFDNDVKAVTYHEAELVTDENGNHRCIIVLDI